MPNWVANSLSITGAPAAIKELRNVLREKDGKNPITFSAIIPQPANIFNGPIGANDKAYYPSTPDITDEKSRKLLEDAVQKFMNDGGSLNKYFHSEVQGKKNYLIPLTDVGLLSWSEWNPANWGTKWDACDIQEVQEIAHTDGLNKLVYGFNTAWSPAIPVVEELIKQHPDLVVEYRYAEEGGCPFAGMLFGANGEVVNSYEVEDTEDPRYLALFEDVWGWVPGYDEEF